MREIRVSSWSELNVALYENSYKDNIKRFRSDFVYRGIAESTFQLESSLMRLGGDYKNLEKHLLRNFRKYAHRDIALEPSLWNWLSLAQHHGLPTRLMDWTYSPLVALHFATCDLDAYDKDGGVWCVDYVKIHKNLPAKLGFILEKEGCNAFTAHLLSEGADTLEKFDALSKDTFAVFFEPPSMDDRIVNQYALFSVLSNSTMKMGEWLKNHEEFCQKIVIPKELKWEIRDKLDQSNITERVLLPGLSGLCQWLKRHYSPNPLLR